MLCLRMPLRPRSKGLPHGLWDTSKLPFLFYVVYPGFELLLKLIKQSVGDGNKENINLEMLS